MVSERTFDRVVIVIAAAITIAVAYPLVFVLSASFSNPSAVTGGQMWLYPIGFSLEPYRKVFENANIWTGYWNTVVYTAVGTLINIVLTILAAYPLSRKDLPGRNFLMFVLVFTMFFHGGLIPTYLVVQNLGMVNTLWAMVLPNAIITYNLIVMRTFFQTGIPVELQEAAWMDGCSNTRFLTRIVLPLSKPIIAVMILFYSVDHWNAYFNALIYLQDSVKYPLQLVLRNILILNQVDDLGLSSFGIEKQVQLAESIKYAIIFVSVLPVLMIYPFVQRYFVKGVMIGSIKG